MPTSYSDIAVVTSPKIQITDERIEIVESTLLELKPFIECINSLYYDEFYALPSFVECVMRG